MTDFMNWSQASKEDKELRLKMVNRIGLLYGQGVDAVAKEMKQLYDVEKIDPFYWVDLMRTYAGEDNFAAAREMLAASRRTADL